MTINEAIEIVLRDSKRALSPKDIWERIAKAGYLPETAKAATPQATINSQLCALIDKNNKKSNVRKLLSGLYGLKDRDYEPGKHGFVYVLSNACFDRSKYGNGLVKIGCAESLYERISNLKTSVPEDFVVEYVLFCASIVDREDLVHTRLAKCRVADDKEFFECTPKEAYAAMIWAAKKSKLPVECVKKVGKTWTIADEREYGTLKGKLQSRADAEANKAVVNLPSGSEPAIVKKVLHGNASIEGMSFYAKSKNYNACMRVEGQKYVLCAHSIVSSNINESCVTSVKYKREQMNGLIDSKGILTVDVDFDSVSAAAMFVAGCATSGLTFWKTKDGLQLKQVMGK